MSKLLVTDALWAVVEPLLPPEPPKPKGGRLRVPARAALPGSSRARARVEVGSGRVTVRLRPPSPLRTLARELEVSAEAAVAAP